MDHDSSSMAAHESATPFARVEPHMRSRLVYASPVCVLAARQPQTGDAGAMVVSWLAALDNSGHLSLSIRTSRHTHSILFPNDTEDNSQPLFTLSVPTFAFRTDLLKIGGVSGKDIPNLNHDLQACLVPKLTHLGINTTERWPIQDPKGHDDPLCGQVFVDDPRIAAVLVCRVESRLTVCHGHSLIIATIVDSVVRTSHWDGRNFAYIPPQLTNSKDHALLTQDSQLLAFLGTRTFATMSSELYSDITTTDNQQDDTE